MSYRFWIQMGSLFMLLGIAVGAFGAHGLKHILSPEMKQVYETGVQYQIYHALALFIVAGLVATNSSRSTSWAGYFFIAGILLFSGSLYALSLSGIKKIGWITPVGGLSFLIGWALLLFSAYP